MSDIFDLFKKIQKKDPVVSKPEYIVAGLGNPDLQYKFTRHNIGFDALDFISLKLSSDISDKKFKSLVSFCSIDDKSVLLMKPLTYMNLSGEAIKSAADFYKIDVSKIIIISDDIYQNPGEIRIRNKGSAGGHNGLKNIIEALGSEEFFRIRIGVGNKPNDNYDLISWVLGKIPEEDRELIEKRFNDIYESVRLLLNNSFDEAMNRFNYRANSNE